MPSYHKVNDRPYSPFDHEVNDPFTSLGEQLCAIRSAAQLAGTSGMVDPRLHELNRLHQLRRLNTRAATGASEAVPSDGGFLLAPAFAQELVNKTYSTGALLSRMTRIPFPENSNTLSLPGFDEQSRVDGARFGGMHSAWANEADSALQSKPKFRKLTLTAKKLIGVFYASDELASDARTLQAAIELAFTNEFVFKLEKSALFGNGSSAPLGILDPSCKATVIAPEIDVQTPGTLLAANVLGMWERLWGASHPNAVWLVSQEILPLLLQMTIPVGTGGSELPMYVPTVAGERYGRLLGIPCIPSEYCSVVGTFGDIILLDPTQYLLAEKRGIERAVSIHVQFLTDQSVFRFVWRVDGQPMWHTALTPANGDSGIMLSPYIGLDPRT